MLTLPTHPGIFVIVLGNMQDGGLPHAGCRCANCQRAWQDPRHQQYVTCLAVVDTRLPSPLVYLLDATPDIKFQLNMLGDLLGAHATRPGRLRQPDGIFLTHAHIGHIAGLAQLSKEAMFVQQLPLFASPRLRQLIHQTVLWQPLVSQLTLHDLLPHTAVNLAHDATLTPILVPHRDEWNTGTYGFLLRGPQRSLFYLPDIDGWSRWSEARTVLAQVDTAVVDGAFYALDEVGKRDGREQLFHTTIRDTLQFWQGLEDTRLVFTHLNHTNPALAPDSPERAQIDAAGASIAQIGQIFEL